MNSKKIIGTVLAVLFIVFVIAPHVSAQQYANILDGQWFKVKASMKGYAIASDLETVLGKTAGSAPSYMKFTYDNGVGEYTLMTCAQDDYNPNLWHKSFCGPISTDEIYGAIYPQIWDFGGTPIDFYDGYSTYSLYTVLYTKITADGPTLKQATISTVSCGIWAEFDSGQYGIGSCTITGSLIPSTQVATKVPPGCQ